MLKRQSLVNEYVTMKLASGEEIMCKILDEDDATFTVDKPHILYVQQDQNGQPQAALMPFMQLSDPKSSVPIFKTSIVCVAKLVEQAKNDYKQAIGDTTGLIMPQKTGLQMP